MKRVAVTVMILCLVSPAWAGLTTDEIDEGVYLVSYERGRWTSATILDTAQKARRKVEKLSHRFCLEEGYAYLRFPTLGEISRDENLRAVWEFAAGDEPADDFEISGGDRGIVSKAHKVRRILILSELEEAGFDRCVNW